MTWTVSFWLPGVSVALTRPTEETSSPTLPSVNVLKPAFWISTRYVPGGRKGMVKTPSALVVEVRLTPVAVSTAVTVASGTTAPEESVTVPVRVAVTTCAFDDTAKSSARMRAAGSAQLGFCGTAFLRPIENLYCRGWPLSTGFFEAWRGLLIFGRCEAAEFSEFFKKWPLEGVGELGGVSLTQRRRGAEPQRKVGIVRGHPRDGGWRCSKVA